MVQNRQLQSDTMAVLGLIRKQAVGLIRSLSFGSTLRTQDAHRTTRGNKTLDSGHHVHHVQSEEITEKRIYERVFTE